MNWAMWGHGTSAGTRAVDYCQPNFKTCDQNGKTFHSSSSNILRHRSVSV